MRFFHIFHDSKKSFYYSRIHLCRVLDSEAVQVQALHNQGYNAHSSQRQHDGLLQSLAAGCLPGNQEKYDVERHKSYTLIQSRDRDAGSTIFDLCVYVCLEGKKGYKQIMMESEHLRAALPQNTQCSK